VSLAAAIAAASSSNATIGATGPKTSSSSIALSAATLSSTVAG
jgi:hypothetical protein